MNSLLHEDILNDYLSELKRIWLGDIKLLTNNHSIRKSMNSLILINLNQIKVIDFPPYSPDLNIIENIYRKLKKR